VVNRVRAVFASKPWGARSKLTCCAGVSRVEIHWPNGQMNTMKDVKPNQLVAVKEGEGIIRTVQFDHAEGRPLK
jgi:ASPIC and UnbV